MKACSNSGKPLERIHDGNLSNDFLLLKVIMNEVRSGSIEKAPSTKKSRIHRPLLEENGPAGIGYHKKMFMALPCLKEEQKETIVFYYGGKLLYFVCGTKK